MLRKESEIRWIVETNKSFGEAKQALSSAPILVTLDYSKYIILFSFA